jgi:flagellar FliL protein
MAEDNDLTMEDGPSGSKKMIIIIAAVILILLAVGGFFMFSSSDDSEEPVTAETEVSNTQEQMSEPEPANTGTAMYVTMPRPFTFNVPGTTRDRLVQIKVQLMVRGDNDHELAKRHIPLIEGTLLKAFSTANADDLATVAGKDAVKTKAINDVQKAVYAVAGSKIIEDVLFTGFVMQ